MMDSDVKKKAGIYSYVWTATNITWSFVHSMTIPNEKSMNAREGIAPIRTAYVRMKFWISERWRLITLLRGGMEAGLLLIIARCCVGIVIGEKEQIKIILV